MNSATPRSLCIRPKPSRHRSLPPLYSKLRVAPTAIVHCGAAESIGMMSPSLTFTSPRPSRPFAKPHRLAVAGRVLEINMLACKVNKCLTYYHVVTQQAQIILRYITGPNYGTEFPA